MRSNGIKHPNLQFPSRSTDTPVHHSDPCAAPACSQPSLTSSLATLSASSMSSESSSRSSSLWRTPSRAAPAPAGGGDRSRPPPPCPAAAAASGRASGGRREERAAAPRDSSVIRPTAPRAVGSGDGDGWEVSGVPWVWEGEVETGVSSRKWSLLMGMEYG